MTADSPFLLALVDGAIKGSITVGVAAALCGLLRRGYSGLRASVWLVAVLSYPFWTLVAVLPVSVTEVRALGFPTATTLTIIEAGLPTASSTMTSVAGVDLVEALPQILTALWIGGFVVGCARLVYGLLKIRLRLAAASRISGAYGEWAEGLAASMIPGRSVRILQYLDCAVPYSTGLLRPVVVLPARTVGGPRSDLLPILLHELEHARRRDPLVRTIARFASCLFWWLPLPWIALRQLREEQEKTCDEAVVAQGIAPEDYARLLVEAMRDVLPAGASGFGAPTRHLERRVRSILDSPFRRSSAMKATHRALSVIALSLIVPLALVRCAGAPIAPQAAAGGPGVVFAWPVADRKGHVTAWFGSSQNPFAPGTWYLHKGIDIAWLPGTPVLAGDDGKVRSVSKDAQSDYGEYVIVNHHGGYSTRYAHLATTIVKPGQLVHRGQQVGTMGNTGMSLGDKLHFEVMHDDLVVDPRPFLEDLGS
jgi:murein DD-endopeptidase MepM/ murein hydrolase activator NlpD